LDAEVGVAATVDVDSDALEEVETVVAAATEESAATAAAAVAMLDLRPEVLVDLFLSVAENRGRLLVLFSFFPLFPLLGGFAAGNLLCSMIR
jgi:hypothetical protein